jgi:hypothetical protein
VESMHGCHIICYHIIRNEGKHERALLQFKIPNIPAYCNC